MQTQTRIHLKSIHQNGFNPNSQIEVNSQIAKLQGKMKEIKGLLTTLT